jgi:hypothetical protein
MRRAQAVPARVNLHILNGLKLLQFGAVLRRIL